MKTTLCIAVSLLTALSALPSHSAPVQLSEAAFAGALAPLTGSVEDFEGFSSGFKSKPLQLANAVFVSDNPYVGLESQIAPTKILIDQAGDNVEVFSSFLPGTTVFGIDIFALNEGNEVNVTVVGGTGTSVFRSSFDALDGFFGVQDPLGLLSVSFQRLRNQATLGNFAFDNLTTGAAIAAAVPEPGSMALAAAGMLALLGTGRRRSGARLTEDRQGSPARRLRQP